MGIQNIQVSANHGFNGGKVDAAELNERLCELGETGREIFFRFATNMDQSKSSYSFVILKHFNQ